MGQAGIPVPASGNASISNIVIFPDAGTGIGGTSKIMETVIEKIVYPGKSLGRLNSKAVFTDEGLPGELADIKIIKEKKDYIIARTIKILKNSPHRVKPRCEHYKICSSYQYIDYPLQVEIKMAQVKEMFLKTLGIDMGNKKMKPSRHIWGYRNNAQLHVVWENNTPHLAYHKPERFNEFVRIEKCFLLSDKINSELSKSLDELKNKRLYSIEELVAREKAQENIDGKKFFIGPNSFFQVNIPMLKELLVDLKAALRLSGKETIADLYCGIGTFGILLAEKVKKVIAVELSEDNMPFLRMNIEINNIANISVYDGASEKLIDEVLRQIPDVVLLDPPRKGIGPEVCNKLIAKPPEILVYISCDPATMVRDLKILMSAYKLKDLSCYDFFPQTPHIETMCVLEKK